MIVEKNFLVFILFLLSFINIAQVYSKSILVNNTYVSNSFFLNQIFGFSIALTLIGVSVKYFGNYNFLLFYLTTVIAILISLKKAKINFEFLYKPETIILIIFIFFLVVFWSINNELSVRWHINPDPTGYLALFGYFNENPNSLLLERVLAESIAVDPQTFTRIPWQLPDAQLRFAADLAISAGRLSHVGLISSLNRVFNTTEYFWSIWLSLAVYSVWIISLLFGEIFKVFKNDILKKRKKIFYVVIGVFLCLMPIHLLLIAEGISAQLQTTSILLGLYYIHILYINRQISFLLLGINQLIFYIAMYFAYPQAYFASILIFLIPNLMIFIYFICYEKNLIKFIKSISLYLVIFIPLLFDFGLTQRTLNLTFRGVIGVAGGAVNLGYPLLNDLIGFGFKPIRFTPLGFESINLNFNLMLLQLLIFFITISFAILLITRNKNIFIRFYDFFYIAAPYFIFNSTFFYSLIRMQKTNNINQYFVLRQIHIFLLFSIILIIIVLSKKNLQSFNLKSKLFSILFKVIALFIVINMLNNSIYLWKSYSKNSSDPQYFASCPPIDFSNSIFVSKIPEHLYFHLALCGPFYYATDNWQPKFPISEGKKWKVYELDKKNKPKFLGNLVLKKNFDTPCNVECINFLIKNG